MAFEAGLGFLHFVSKLEIRKMAFPVVTLLLEGSGQLEQPRVPVSVVKPEDAE